MAVNAGMLSRSATANILQVLTIKTLKIKGNDISHQLIDEFY